MDYSKLNELFKEVIIKYPKMDYFTREKIFQYMRMSFHVGYDLKLDRIESKPVLRSDGKPYTSINKAAKENNIDHRSITRAIEKGYKAGGYNWKYKTKQP